MLAGSAPSTVCENDTAMLTYMHNYTGLINSKILLWGSLAQILI